MWTESKREQETFFGPNSDKVGQQQMEKQSVSTAVLAGTTPPSHI